MLFSEKMLIDATVINKHRADDKLLWLVRLQAYHNEDRGVGSVVIAIRHR